MGTVSDLSALSTLPYLGNRSGGGVIPYLGARSRLKTGFTFTIYHQLSSFTLVFKSVPSH